MSHPNPDRDKRVDQIREAASLIRIWMYRNDFDAERCAKEVFDLFRQQCPERFFWVIERFEDGQSAGYWNGMNSRSFVTNIEAAIQFRRREDALPIKSSWHWRDVKITEHGYVAPFDGQTTTNDVNWTPREFAEHVVAQWSNYANPVDAIEALLKERDSQNGYDAGVLTPDELTEIRRRRAAMLFPDGRPTGPWLDVDRLLAHQEALRQAVNVRNQAISKQTNAATRMRDRCAESAKQIVFAEMARLGISTERGIAVSSKVFTALQSLTLEGEQEK